MLSGDQRIDDYTNVSRPTLAEMYDSTQWQRWPIMAWDVDVTYWIHSSWSGQINKSKEPLKMVDVVMTSSVNELADNARICCDWDHEILCSNGMFMSLRKIVDDDISVQHGRGMGHNVRVKSVIERKDKEFGFSFNVDKYASFCHCYVIHRDGK